jgi:uncharacterized membrane protein
MIRFELLITFGQTFDYSQIVFAHPEWVSASIVFAVLLLATTLLTYRSSKLPLWLRGVSLLCRAIGIGLLLVCLLEPMAKIDRPKSQANVFAIVVDRSKSLDIVLKERAKQDDNRFEKILGNDSEWQRKLADDFRVRRYTLDSGLEPIDTLEGTLFTGSESAIYHSLHSLGERFKGRPLAGVFLLSDGQATDRRTDQSLSELGFPIYPVSVGSVANEKDIRIVSLTTRQSDFETAPVTILAQCTQKGYSGQSAMIDLVDSAGKVIQTQTLKWKGNSEPVNAEFRFRPEQSGVQGYKVVIRNDSATGSSAAASVESSVSVAGSEELTLANNSRYQVVDRGRGPYRILYVSGRPNWEYKFLKRSLEEDDEIQLTTLIRIARKEMKFSFRDSKVDSSNPLFSGFEDIIAEEKEQYDEPVFARLGLTNASELKRGFPKDASELFEYSAVIIDDLEHDFFSPNQNSLLRQFVTARGGGLLMLGGQESMRGRDFQDSAFAQLLPFYCDDGLSEKPNTDGGLFDSQTTPTYRFQLTREGWLQPFLRMADSEAAEKARLDGMPLFEVLNRAKGVKPGASVLAEVKGAGDELIPILATQRFGKGRTAALMLGDMWRWGMRHQGSDPAPLFQAWRQMIRWLISDVPKPIQMKLDDTSSLQRITKIQIDVKGPDFKTIENAKVSVTTRSPSGVETQSVADSSSEIAGRYEISLVLDEEGVYSASAVAQSADGSPIGSSQMGWVHEPSIRELQEIGENTNALESIAKETGGQVIDLNDLDSFVDALPTKNVPITETKMFPLWHQGWILILALGCICLEWGVRRRYGLS